MSDWSKCRNLERSLELPSFLKLKRMCFFKLDQLSKVMVYVLSIANLYPSALPGGGGGGGGIHLHSTPEISILVHTWVS